MSVERSSHSLDIFEQMIGTEAHSKAMDLEISELKRGSGGEVRKQEEEVLTEGSGMPRLQRGSMGVERESPVRMMCSCMKTKCVKKYCSCFAGGFKCKRGCRCEECENWEEEKEEVMVTRRRTYVEYDTTMKEEMEFEAFAYN